MHPTEKMMAILRNYTCQFWVDGNGDGVGLEDVFTPDEDDGVTSGLNELWRLADYLAEELDM